MNNYTPIDIKKIQNKFAKAEKKGINADTILLLFGTLLAVALIFMLFILIQKKMQTPTKQESTVISLPTPTLEPTATPTTVPTLEPTAIPTISTNEAKLSVTPTASVSATPTVSIKPSITATPSATPIVSPAL